MTVAMSLPGSGPNDSRGVASAVRFMGTGWGGVKERGRKGAGLIALLIGEFSIGGGKGGGVVPAGPLITLSECVAGRNA